MFRKAIDETMSITKKDIEHIARLARIELTEDEQEKFGKDIASILDFVNQLNKVDTQAVSPLAGGLLGGALASLEDETRIDEEKPPLGNPAELVNAAPTKEEGFIEVKAVFRE